MNSLLLILMFVNLVWSYNRGFLNKKRVINCKQNDELYKSDLYYDTKMDIKKKDIKKKVDIENKIKEYKEVENGCVFDFTSKEDLKELEEIEKDMLDIFQRMREHNTKRIYKTTKELLKLFKQ